MTCAPSLKAQTLMVLKSIMLRKGLHDYMINVNVIGRTFQVDRRSGRGAESLISISTLSVTREGGTFEGHTTVEYTN